jgi:hypothetical protein
MDTRPAPLTVGTRATPLGPAETHTIAVIAVSGNCNVPVDATGVVMNVTAVDPTQPSFLTVFPGGVARPLASNLNFVAGQAPTPNAVTVDVPASGQVSFYNHEGTVNVVADIVGYYVDHTHDDRYYTEAEVDALVDALVGVVGYAGGNQVEALTTTDTVYRTVTINPPSAGTVIVNSSGYIWHTDTNGFVARCAITTGSGLDTSALQYVESPSGTIGQSEVIAGTRGFDVTQRGPLTVNLVCDVNSGQANLSDTWLSAIFVPN